MGEYDRGLKHPFCYEARVSYLKKEVELVDERLKGFNKEWKKTCCTVMSNDARTDGKSRPLTKFSC